jgi:hypothetical protein
VGAAVNLASPVKNNDVSPGNHFVITVSTVSQLALVLVDQPLSDVTVSENANCLAIFLPSINRFCVSIAVNALNPPPAGAFIFKNDPDIIPLYIFNVVPEFISKLLLLAEINVVALPTKNFCVRTSNSESAVENLK